MPLDGPRNVHKPEAPLHAVAKLHGGFAAGQFVLGILELNDLASSPICNSVCKKLHEHGRKQASPFKLSELEVLHQVLSDVSQDRWDRLMAGMIFLTVSCTCSCVVYK